MMKMRRIIFNGCLIAVFAGYMNAACAFEGVYRMDCDSIVVPNVMDHSDRAQSESRSQCKAQSEREASIKMMRNAVNARWQIQMGENPPVYPFEEKLSDSPCLIMPSVAICKFTPGEDIDLTRGEQPAYRSRTGMVIIVTATNGWPIMIADLVKTEKQ
jgi:hypothetical protein